MSFGALLDATFRIYAQAFSPLATLSLVCNLPLFLVAVWAAFLDPEQQTVAGGVYRLVSIVTASLLVGSLTHAISERYLGRPISVRGALSRTLACLAGLIGTQFLVGLWVGLGLLLLIVPGILWAFSLSLVVPVVMLEATRGFAALDRSKALVSYDRGKVVGVIVATWILVILLAMALGMSLGIAAELAASGSAQTAANLGGELIGYLLQPLSSIALVLLYYDLRIRKEGFDLEMLSGEMARS